MRHDPPVSVPRATSAAPSATAAAEPELDPPGTRPGAAGLAAVPSHSLMPLTPKANSCNLVVPTTAAPAARRAATTAASTGSTGASRRARLPARNAWPPTAMRSFTASRSPSSRPVPVGSNGRSARHTHGLSSVTRAGL